MPSNIGNKKTFSNPKQEKKIRVELVSKYTLNFGGDRIYTEYFEYSARELKGTDWGEYIGHDLYANEDLFPCFSELDHSRQETPAITFEAYTVDKNNVRNGPAQGLTCDRDRWLLRWEAQFKNGKQHGKRIEYYYEVRVIRRPISKLFYVDDKRVDAKTVTEWRKIQAEMQAASQDTQTRKK